MSTVLTGVGRGWGKIKTSESEQYVEKTSNKPLRQVRPIRFSKKCVSTVAASCQIFEEYDMHVFSHYQSPHLESIVDAVFGHNEDSFECETKY